MAVEQVIKSIDILEYCPLGLASCFPTIAPGQLGLDGFEERLHRRIIIAVCFATHRPPKSVLARDLVMVVRTILAATVDVMEASFGRCPQCDRHLQRPDCQVAFHAIAYRPADHTPQMQVEDYSRIQPALARPDIGNVSCPFLVWLIRCEITIRQVWRNVELVIAVCRHLVFASSNHGYAVVAHQTPNTAVPDIKANLFEFFSHTRPAIAAKAETGLFFDVGQRDHVRALSATG